MKFKKLVKSSFPTKEELLMSAYKLSGNFLSFYNDGRNAENKTENEDIIVKILEHIDQISILTGKLKF